MTASDPSPKNGAANSEQSIVLSLYREIERQIRAGVDSANERFTRNGIRARAYYPSTIEIANVRLENRTEHPSEN